MFCYFLPAFEMKNKSLHFKYCRGFFIRENIKNKQKHNKNLQQND
ncbi:MAG: hypothetical protein WCG25_05190 [bacterium]